MNQTNTDALEFRIFMPEAGAVELVGTFTNWRDGARPMRRGSDGWWTISLALDPGDHEFQYLVDGQHWLADYAAGGLRLNKYGTWVSLLHVPLDEEAYVFEPAREPEATQSVALRKAA